MSSHKRVLAAVTHADDELACAGTLARFSSEGAKVKLAVANVPNLNSAGKWMGRRAKKNRRAELQKSAASLGVGLEIVKVNDDQLTWHQSTVQKYDKIVNAFEPDLIITQRVQDTHQAHSALAHVIRSVCRKNRIAIWEMDQPLPGGLEPDAPPPNMLVNISAYTNQKEQAICHYQSQIDRYPDFYKAYVCRNLFLGWTMGVNSAEVFRVEKEVWT